MDRTNAAKANKYDPKANDKDPKANKDDQQANDKDHFLSKNIYYSMAYHHYRVIDPINNRLIELK
ncbi:hypothetical protein HL669_23575 [Vibrio parahaemolyticus]|uniref:hypothetical protein n=1 Tax=Vibrio parahaemolyticus TaxID=670 RepID=UPI00148554BB|nr:hypothetical protein [Vibrio parahaemolyticus]ELB2105290.1 hypothetical protein [Vibrio parahaemolyticus]NNU14577.1 hypothetical protein [Vibrio parahaemolyticus]